jgi:hypothetical protein
MINFRLTEQEYEELKRACAQSGARCLSDFAREAVLRLTQSEILLDSTVQNRFEHLDNTLSSMASSLKHLARALHSEEDSGERSEKNVRSLMLAEQPVRAD